MMESIFNISQDQKLCETSLKTLASGTSMEHPYMHVRQRQSATAGQHNLWRQAIQVALDTSDACSDRSADEINQIVISELTNNLLFYRSLKSAADAFYASHPDDYTHRFPLTSLRNTLVLEKCIYLLTTYPDFLACLIQGNDLLTDEESLTGFKTCHQDTDIIPWSGGTTANRLLEAPIDQESDYWGTVKPSMLTHILSAAARCIPGVDPSCTDDATSVCAWSYRLPEAFPTHDLVHSDAFLERKHESLFVKIFSGGYAFGGVGTYLARQGIDAHRCFFPMDCGSFIYDFYPEISQRFSTTDHYLLGRGHWTEAVDCPENKKGALASIHSFFNPVSFKQVQPGDCWIVRTVTSSKIQDPNDLGRGGHMAYWVTGYQTTAHLDMAVTLECNRDISVDPDDFMGIDGFGLRARPAPWMNDSSPQPGVVPIDEQKCHIHFVQKMSLFNPHPGNNTVEDRLTL